MPKRMNYFDHQFLRAPDFTDEQNYHVSMRRLHNSTLHTWGIVQGLLVAPATGTAVTVGAGVAVDSKGQEIVLAAATNLELGGESAGSTLFITIAYDEQQTDPTTEAGGPGNTRITEAPKLSFSKVAPADKSMTLILAKVPRTSTGLGPVDGSDRTQAGVKLGDNLTVKTLTLQKDGVDPSNWPALSCSAANQAALTNSGLFVNGNVGIGASASRGRLEVNGMVGNTVGLFGDDLGVSLVASSPSIGFNSYFNGSWKAISPGWSGVIAVDQNDGSMTISSVPTKANAADAALALPTRLSIHADGKMVSPMWRTTQVINQRQGALPISATFPSGGGTLVVIFSGSGFAGSATVIGMNLQIDGVTVSNTRSFTNEPSSHKTFTTNIHVQSNIAAGTHSIGLAPLAGTVTDGNDFFNVTVLELPF
jgi:hypothetical protein